MFDLKIRILRICILTRIIFIGMNSINLRYDFEKASSQESPLVRAVMLMLAFRKQGFSCFCFLWLLSRRSLHLRTAKSCHGNNTAAAEELPPVMYEGAGNKNIANLSQTNTAAVSQAPQNLTNAKTPFIALERVQVFCPKQEV